MNGLLARRSDPAFLPRDPAHQHRPSRAEHRAQAKDGQACALCEVIDFAPAAALAEYEFGDLVRAVEQVAREFV